MSISNRSISANLTLTCKHCGRSFKAYPSTLSRKYCSAVCRKTGKQNVITCAKCGKSVAKSPSRKAVYCTRECARKPAKAPAERRPPVRTRETRQCTNCGNSFAFMPSQLNAYKGAGRYCSRNCSYAGQVKINATKPIKDKYGRSGRKADREWQLAVREKDNYTCQRCGKYELYIHTHHVAPRSRRPDLRHDVANGKCLCNVCHLWAHHHPIEATAAGLLSDASYERDKRPKNFCKVCGKPAFGLGYCANHYRHFKKYGDPLLTKRRGHREEAPRLETELLHG